MQIRVATPADATAIADIYAPIVRETVISFESDPPSAKEMVGRITKTLQSHPWLVAVEDGTILGYAYGAQFRARVRLGKCPGAARLRAWGNDVSSDGRPRKPASSAQPSPSSQQTSRSRSGRSAKRRRTASAWDS